MSGHSKWKNIMHKKEASDAKRGKVFTKIGREIAMAIREGGADPASNAKLKDVIAKAKANNVPNDNIKRMLEKYQGGGDGAQFESITYEGYGPSGVAVIVETATDNRNRTAAEMRHYFDKYGGNLGATGCVSWQFAKKGVLVIQRDGQDEDEMMMQALEAGAEDFSAADEMFEIVTDPDLFGDVRDRLESQGVAFAQAEVQMVPSVYVSLTGEDDLKNMQKLLDMLDDNDDVQSVWHNWEE